MTALRARIIDLAERAMRNLDAAGPGGRDAAYPMIAGLRAMAIAKQRTIKGSTPGAVPAEP